MNKSIHSPHLTKITAPRTHKPVFRSRLFKRLDELYEMPITWLVGAPGAGKTTLVSTYLSKTGIKHIWYQIDAGDADPATFFHYFRLAVESVTPSEKLNLPVLTPEFLPGLTVFVRRYAEIVAISVSQPMIIVLDNFEQVPDSSMLAVIIRELATSFPPHIRILVLSRTEPPEVFAKLRVYGHLSVLGHDELNLTLDEAQDVAGAKQLHNDIRFESNMIEHVLFETKGWLAGFTLLLTDCRKENIGFSGSNNASQLLFDYFATELLEHFPVPMQRALICCALLPTMSISDIHRLTGDPDIGTVLADLQRRNCFVVQKGLAEPIYEFHTLFRAFLLSKAVTIFATGEWRALQQTAADLLADSRQVDAAAGLYQLAEHWPGLAGLALKEGPTLILEGRHQVLDQWLNQIPLDVYNSNPWLSYWHGMARLPFDPVSARSYFEHAYEGFRSATDVKGLYLAWTGVMDSFFYEWQDLRPADHWIREFEALWACHPEFPSRTVELRTYWAMGTLLHRQPQHPIVPLWAERAEAILNRDDSELSVLLGGYLIIHHLWRGNSTKANELIRRLDPWTQCRNFPPLVSILWLCAVGLFNSVRGDMESCLKVIETGLSIASKTGLTCWNFLLSAQAARCSLVAGSLADADTWIARMTTTMRNHSHINGGFVEHLRSNAAIQRGEWHKAVEHARHSLTMAQESGVPFLEAHCRIDLARALIGQGDLAEWQGHLQIAYQIGQGMNSQVLLYLYLESQAMAAFERGDQIDGKNWLAQTLALSKTMGEPIWQMSGPRNSTRLYELALTLGLESDHVRQLIRRHHLTPSDPASTSDFWPWPIRIYTLGRFEILRDDEPIRSSRKAQHKPLELIKALCAFGGLSVHQDRITEALWPDAEGDAAEQAFSTTLHRLRKLLQYEQAIRLEDRQLTLDSRYVWVDALAFDRIAHHPHHIDQTSLQTALNRYRGHFLLGESASWALVFRERLRSQFLKISERLGASLEEAGDCSAAIDCYQRVIGIEPAAERFYRLLMACHIQLGQRAEALTVFQRCRQALLTHLGVSPTQETQALYQRLLDS